MGWIETEAENARMKGLKVWGPINVKHHGLVIENCILIENPEPCPMKPGEYTVTP